jgi:hypothetical protein
MIIAALVFLPFIFALLMPFAVRKNAGDKAALLLMLVWGLLLPWSGTLLKGGF